MGRVDLTAVSFLYFYKSECHPASKFFSIFGLGLVRSRKIMFLKIINLKTCMFG